MATGLEERKFWFQTRPGEGWTPPNQSSQDMLHDQIS